MLDFLKIFIPLLSRGYAELERGSNKIEEIIGGIWTRPDKPSSVAKSSDQVNPLVLNVGRVSFEEALRQYISIRTGNELNLNTRPKMEVPPSYIFVVLNWELPPTEKNSAFLPYFLLTPYVTSRVGGSYVAHALIFQSESDGRYMTQVHRQNSWMLFDDEVSSAISVTNDLQGVTHYKGKRWRCVMIVYSHTSSLEDRGFDISQSLRSNIQAIPQRKKEEHPLVAGKVTSLLSAQEEIISFPPSPPSKKRERSLQSSSFSAASSTKSPKIALDRSPSPPIEQCYSAKKTSESSLPQSLPASRSFSAGRKSTRAASQRIEDLPRIESFVFFVEDMRALQTHSEFASAVLVSKKTQSRSFSNKSDAQETQLRTSYVNLSLRIMLAHYASTYASEQAELYVQALRYCTELVETVYAADRAFFVTVRMNLQTLRKQLLIEKKGAAKQSIFEKLSQALLRAARLRGLLEEELPELSTERKSAVVMLEELLAESSFRNVKTVAKGLERVKRGEEIDEGLGTVLRKAREAYLNNYYNI